MHQRNHSIQIATSTAAAAVRAANQENVAAIAGLSAKQEYGLKLLHPNPIQDKAGNRTRFWVIGHAYSQIPAGTPRKSAVLLKDLDRDATGCLQEALACYAKHGCGLSLIYPVPHPEHMWEYSFLLELESSCQDAIEAGNAEYMSKNLGKPPMLLGAYENLTTASRLLSKINQPNGLTSILA